MRPWLLWIAVSASLAATPAAAEIFRCKTKDGVDLYQNFPCEFDSLGSLPVNAPRSNASSESADRAPPKSRARDGQAAAAPNLAGAREPRAGMTPEQVKALWGEPDQVVQDEPRSGREEVWEYGGGKVVRFNAHKQRVSSVQR